MMPRALELEIVDGEVWARVGVVGDFPSGVTLWTDSERAKALAAVEAETLEQAAQVADDFAARLNSAVSEGRLHQSVEANTYFRVSMAIAAAIRALKEGPGTTSPEELY